MPVTVSQMLVDFPEFVRAGEGIVAAKLADAEGMIAPDYGGELRDQIVKYQTAHLLGLSPHAQFARLDPNKDPDGARTIYERQLLELLQSTRGPMVI